MIEMIARGGVLMYVLLGFSVLSVGLLCLKSGEYAYLRISRSAVHRYQRIYRTGGLDSLIESCESGHAGYAPILRSLQHSLASGVELQLTEKEVQMQGLEGVETAERHLHLLGLIGTISPLIGLFGTVLGLSRTFFDIASATGAVDAGLLAGGIWEAMITTIGGLTVGIPAQMGYHLLSRRVDSWALALQVLINGILTDHEREGLS